ncbi:MAG: hypothetical protein GAK43_00904 [Stenotrophomonas maltophilia]|nr:MAG: hypothetical protein GAK43_00904 [Stenotrophomonas maltophilia]
MAETAYYRLVLWDGMSSPPPSGRILSEHLSFEARFQVERGVRLHQPPFAEFHEQLCHPRDYRATQALGTAMRAATVQAFEFRSARCPAQGINAALFLPEGFVDRRPRNLMPWLCETTQDYVAFKHAQVQEVPRRFERTVFLVDGVLPLPA